MAFPRLARAAACALAAALLAFPGCADDARDEPPARLLVAVWTDLRIPAQLDRLEAVLSQGTAERVAVRPLDPNGQDQPVVLTVNLGLLRRTRPLDLLVVGRAGGLVLVERRVLLPRLPPGDSALAVTLEARCAGRTCDSGWTCVRGACERADAPVDALAPSVADLPPDPLGGLVAGRRIIGCDTVEECEDGDPCTIDRCDDHFCDRVVIYGPCVQCTTDEECAALPPEPCTVPFCDPYGVCRRHVVAPGTRCDSDDDPCTVQCCREGTICMSFDTCFDPAAASSCLP